MIESVKNEIEKANDSYNRLIELVKKEIEKVNEYNKKYPKKDEQKEENFKAELEEVYELTQRRFLKQISHICYEMDTSKAYPRLLFIDLTYDNKLCYKILCEFDGGWHPALNESGQPFYFLSENIPSQETSAREEKSNAILLLNRYPENIYLKRMMTILKYGILSVQLKIFQEKNDYLTQLFETKNKEEIRFRNDEKLNESYISLRKLFIPKMDSKSVKCELKRVKLKNGKILWLCEKHRNEYNNADVRILDEYEENLNVSDNFDSKSTLLTELDSVNLEFLQEMLKQP